MDHAKWETYLSVCRKIESGGRNTDHSSTPENDAAMAAFLATFSRFLPPDPIDHHPPRVLAPGAISDAVFLAEAGYETHALVLGPDNVKWLYEARRTMKRPELLVPREIDAHDLDYPAAYFDGYFSVQFHEHLLSWVAHLGEVRYCMKDGGIVFVDACGTTNDACKCVWHTNLVPERTVLEQWQFWGFREKWRGSSGDDRPQFVFEMLPMDHPEWANAGYLKWVMRLRAGEKIEYDYHCSRCDR